MPLFAGMVSYQGEVSKPVVERFRLLVVTPVFDYILSVPVGIAWWVLQWMVGAMGLA